MHRKEYVRWIEEAKREGTRQRRVARGVEMLRAGTRRPASGYGAASSSPSVVIDSASPLDVFAHG
jgi:hypothetical protein